MELCAFFYPELDILIPVKKKKNPATKRVKDRFSYSNVGILPNKSKFSRKCP